MTIRVLLVDDSLEVREKLRVLLLQASEIELAGEASDEAEALEKLARTPVDVVVMDLNLPEFSGIGTTRQILLDHPDMNVVIISMQSEPHYVKVSFGAGARGYLLKDCAFENLVEAVRLGALEVNGVYNGHGFIDTERFMGLFHAVAPAEQALDCGSCHNGGGRLDVADEKYDCSQYHIFTATP